MEGASRSDNLWLCSLRWKYWLTFGLPLQERIGWHLSVLWACGMSDYSWCWPWLVQVSQICRNYRLKAFLHICQILLLGRLFSSIHWARRGVGSGKKNDFFFFLKSRDILTSGSKIYCSICCMEAVALSLHLLQIGARGGEQIPVLRHSNDSFQKMQVAFKPFINYCWQPIWIRTATRW